MTPGLESLQHGAGIIDLSTRGRIRVSGDDRARLLHALATNHVQQMRPGEGIYTFFLNAQGRILGDAYLLCFDDHFLIDTEPGLKQALMDHIDHYIISEDVLLEDITENTFALGLEGPRATDVAGRAGLAAPHHRFSHARSGDFILAVIPATGPHGFRLYGPAREKQQAISTLEAAGAILASDADAERNRLDNFVPKCGPDINEHTLPQETQQMHAVHFQKGCYLGQEIVERIRSRGHVNRLLMGFRYDAATAPAPGTKMQLEGNPAGEVTSAALIGKTVCGLAYVRVPGARSGAMAEIEGHAVELFAPRM